MTEPLRYFVHLADRKDRGHTVSADSIEDAAVAFLELTDAPDDEQVRVIVRPCQEGRDHCLVIDLMSGEARPCN